MSGNCLHVELYDQDILPEHIREPFDQAVNSLFVVPFDFRLSYGEHILAGAGLVRRFEVPFVL